MVNKGKKKIIDYFWNYRASASSYKQAYYFPQTVFKETFISDSQNYVWVSLGVAKFLSVGVSVQVRQVLNKCVVEGIQPSKGRRDKAV